MKCLQAVWRPLREIMALMRMFYVPRRRRQCPLRLLILAQAVEEQPLLRMPAQRQPTTVTLQWRVAPMKSADTLQLLPLLLLVLPLQQNPLHPTTVELWKMMVLAQSLPGPRGKTGGRNWVCKGAASR